MLNAISSECTAQAHAGLAEEMHMNQIGVSWGVNKEI